VTGLRRIGPKIVRADSISSYVMAGAGRMAVEIVHAGGVLSYVMAGAGRLPTSFPPEIGQDVEARA
jgi:hypothetical protein